MVTCLKYNLFTLTDLFSQTITVAILYTFIYIWEELSVHISHLF